ncbi:MAG TPA: family 43 glycosylhydrolase [Acidimicrobiales bacterium]|nr:family 43 glycosylhydrolase [Acidimicrobiales bacterium]
MSGRTLRLGATVVAAFVFALAAGLISPPTSRVEAATTANASQAHVGFAPSPSPAFAGDAPDPDVVYSNGTYYAFTTGTPLGNHIQALISASPASGFGSYTGQPFGSTALPGVPGWQQVNTQTSPGVFFYGGHWVMWYDASLSGHGADSGFSCLSVATTSSLPVFTDTSPGAAYCDAANGGVLDPSPFVDPNSGAAYLLWKSNDGSSGAPSRIWSVPLNASGTGFVGAPTVLLTVDQPQLPWETTTDNPQMVLASGVYDLLFSAGNFQSTSYNEALTTCAGPLGPCSQPAAPFLTTYGSAYGPGGGSLFQDAGGGWWLGYAAWNAPCTNYGCGAVRELYTAPIDLSTGLSVPCSPPAGTAYGYRFTASDGGVFTYGNQPFCGSTGGIHINQPVVGIANTSDAGGYWTVARDGGIFSFGDARFFGSTGAMRLNAPIVGVAATRDDGGYWLVASDGGIFSYGDAQFYGSTGALHLNAPIVGMAATPDDGGYWLVASDGGIFNYGDAEFYGSTGAVHLNRPVVGMAATPDGRGYWLVASDGGIFNYGDAKFYGSTGAIHLNAPIVGMAATPDGGGYWLVATDGGIFSYGDAQFYGSTGAVRLNAPIVGMSGP